MAKQWAMEESFEKMHGNLGCRDWRAPACVTDVDVNARLSFTSIKAHEFYDDPEVLKQKVALLAGLVRKARKFMAFTGAGISTAAGIDDYATKSRGDSVVAQDRPRVQDWKDAQPTKAHRVLAAMYERGMLKHWVQQNHDSLPQKAGYPQHALNEIHGSLHDPANPIVPYEGVLRDDLFAWMEEWDSCNDLCLSLGTSLSGFTVDDLPANAARRAHGGRGLGLVIVNLQQTPYDHLTSLRIFAKIDTVMELLAEELEISNFVRPMNEAFVPQCLEGSIVEEDVFLVPFDEDGNPSETKTVWDLRVGRKVKLTGGPYAGDIGEIMEKSQSGHYRIRFENSINPTFKAKRRPFSLWLGNWWLQEATHGYGIVPGGQIPFVNVKDEQQTSQEVAAELPIRRNPVQKPNLAGVPPPPPPGIKGKGKGKGGQR